MTTQIGELCERYNRLVVIPFSRGWSWTGGSPQYSGHTDEPDVLRRLMVAETALRLDIMDGWIDQRRIAVDTVRAAGPETWWITSRHGLNMAECADGRPASGRYAQTLARREEGIRLDQIQALAEAKRRLAETEEEVNAVHDLMYDLLGIERLTHTSSAQLWPTLYA